MSLTSHQAMSLIMDSLAGEISPRDNARLEAWIATHPEASSDSARIRSTWDALGKADPALDVHVPERLTAWVDAQIRTLPSVYGFPSQGFMVAEEDLDHLSAAGAYTPDVPHH